MMMKVLVTLVALVFPTGMLAFVPSSSHRNMNMRVSSLQLQSASTTATSEEESAPTTTTASTTTTTTTTTTKAMFDEFLNEKELLEQSTFPIKPEALMKRAKYVLG